MSEGEPRGVHRTASWEIDRIAERMEQTPMPLHLAKGIEGHGFKAVDPEHPADARTVALFPDQKVVTISTPDLSIKITNATASAAKDGIRVDAGDGLTRALFLRDGHVAVEVFPAPSRALPESPLRGENPPNEDVPESASSIGPESSGDAQTPSQEATETPQMAEQKERQPRVKITGRLGADPHFEESSKSGVIARFPVAEQTSEEQATWHRVYSTGKSAEKIRNANLTKGDTVRVDGYQQERDYRKRDGTTIKQGVVFAVHVKKLAQGSDNERRSQQRDQEEQTHHPDGYSAT